MLYLKLFDRKAVTLMSTVYNSKNTDTGKKHFQTKETIQKPLIMIKYNKYMGGVDANDQLLKYSHFSKRTIKWLKKVFQNVKYLHGECFHSLERTLEKER